MNLTPGDIAIIVFVVLGLAACGLYFLNKWAGKKITAQQSMIEKAKQSASVFVIDKKRDYAKNVNLPKIVSDNLPKILRVSKAYFVQAKVGPQILTLMCDKKVFNAIPVKKTVTLELAGLYIVSIKGMKSDYEKKQEEKKKKLKKKEEEKAAKAQEKKK